MFRADGLDDDKLDVSVFKQELEDGEENEDEATKSGTRVYPSMSDCFPSEEQVFELELQRTWKSSGWLVTLAKLRSTDAIECF